MDLRQKQGPGRFCRTPEKPAKGHAEIHWMPTVRQAFRVGHELLGTIPQAGVNIPLHMFVDWL